MPPKATTPAQQDKTAPADNITSLIAMARELMGDTAGVSDNIYAGQVWLGKGVKTPGDPRRDHSEAGSAARFSPRASNVDLAKTLPLRWRDGSKPSNRKQMERLLRAASEATGRPVDIEDALEIWQKAVDRSSEMWQATLGGKKGKPTTPWEEMAKAARDRKAGIANTLAGDAAKKTTTHKSIYEVSDGDAWAQINRTVEDLMGRAATDSEVREFAYRANQIAASNPTFETTTTDANGNTRTKRSGGATAGDFEMAARKQAFADPEVGAYQAAGPLYNAFVEALSSQGTDF